MPNITDPAFRYTPSFATDIRRTFAKREPMKGSTTVTLTIDIKYDVEHCGTQVNVIDFYTVDTDGYYCTGLQTLPRDARRQIIEQIVCDATDKDRAASASLEDFDPLDASAGVSPLTGGGAVFG